MADTRPKRDVLAIMRRIGMQPDQIAEAERVLPVRSTSIMTATSWPASG